MNDQKRILHFFNPPFTVILPGIIIMLFFSGSTD